jgi:Putative zinc-finger
MTMDEEGGCAYSGTDGAVRYLAGTLSESEVDAFEEHLFACDRCLSEARLGLEIKAAASSPSRGLAGRASRPVWQPVAIAAALAAALLGAWQLQHAKVLAVDGVTRGEDVRALAVKAHPEADGVEVSWTSVPRADVYRVELSTGEGALLLKRDVSGTSVSIGKADLLAAARGPLYVRVTAFDGLRQEIISSSQVPIVPTRPGN